MDAISRPDASTAVTRRRMLVGFRFMAVPSEPLVWNTIVGHGALTRILHEQCEFESIFGAERQTRITSCGYGASRSDRSSSPIREGAIRRAEWLQETRLMRFEQACMRVGPKPNQFMAKLRSQYPENTQGHRQHESGLDPQQPPMDGQFPSDYGDVFFCRKLLSFTCRAPARQPLGRDQ